MCEAWGRSGLWIWSSPQRLLGGRGSQVGGSRDSGWRQAGGSAAVGAPASGSSFWEVELVLGGSWGRKGLGQKGLGQRA